MLTKRPTEDVPPPYPSFAGADAVIVDEVAPAALFIAEIMPPAMRRELGRLLLSGLWKS